MHVSTDLIKRSREARMTEQCVICKKSFSYRHFFVKDIVGYSDYMAVRKEYMNKICPDCIRAKIKEMREPKS